MLHEPAALPSLQFTLYELAARSPRGHLTLAAYRAFGGVDAAIAARAEELYTGLDDPAREGIRRLFERLVVVSADGEPTRRRALRSELAVAARLLGGDVLQVIEAWAQSRLLTLDHHPETREPTVEVAHEALLREWPRLRGWLEEDREAIVALGHLREAAASWAGAGARSWRALPRGSARRGAAARQGRRAATCPRRSASSSRPASPSASANGSTSSSSWSAPPGRTVGCVSSWSALAVALVAALVVGAVAVNQRNEASQERQTATARELAAAANANLEIDPERSVLLALAAVDLARPVGGSALRQAEQALHEAVYASQIEQRFDGVGGAVAWSDDGDRFASSTAEGAVEIRDRATGEVVQTIDAHDDRVNGIAFSPDGALLGTTSEDDTAALWDLATGELLHRFDRPDTDLAMTAWCPRSAAMARASRSPGGASGGRLGGRCRLGSRWCRRSSTTAAIRQSTSFDPTGTMMAVALSTATGAVAVVDVASGKRRLTLDADTRSDVRGVESRRRVDRGGHRHRRLRLRRERPARSGSPSPTSPASSISTGALTRRRIATASRAGTIRVWRIIGRGGLEVFTLSSQATRAGVAGMAFSPDGTALVAGAVDYDTTLVWDTSLAASAEVANLPGALLDSGGAADYAATGDYIITGSPTGVLTVWDAQTYEPIRTARWSGSEPLRRSRPPTTWPSRRWKGAYDLFGVDVSPDGSRVAALVRDNVDDDAANQYAQLRVWDLETWEEPFRRPDERLGRQHGVVSRQRAPGAVAQRAVLRSGAPTLIGVVRVLDRAGQRGQDVP